MRFSPQRTRAQDERQPVEFRHGNVPSERPTRAAKLRARAAPYCIGSGEEVVSSWLEIPLQKTLSGFITGVAAAHASFNATKNQKSVQNNVTAEPK